MILISGRRRWFLLSLKKRYADGQAQAKRLSKSITKESGNLRKLLKKYNSSIEILKQNGYEQFPFLCWEDASDVDSHIYAINAPNEDTIPVTIKRAAIDARAMIERCTEEQEILAQEMASCVKDFHNSHLEQLENNDLFPSSYMMKGSYALHKKELDIERLNLFVACNLFDGSISISDEAKQYLSECCSGTNFVPEEYDTDNDDDYYDDEMDDETAEEDSYSN
ncbi:uncharacterized protein LOC114530440 [Dendronephthya gigantea]|uniref:uncharacterized protein LOC114530440 n=1 Tax=Dendronephthya gigantea TaxID=151771 RepID=UPI001069892D|nr:uncharacterized protein LOC114530440 [Dendronephthya gigantea]